MGSCELVTCCSAYGPIGVEGPVVKIVINFWPHKMWIIS